MAERASLFGRVLVTEEDWEAVQRARDGYQTMAQQLQRQVGQLIAERDTALQAAHGAQVRAAELEAAAARHATEDEELRSDLERAVNAVEAERTQKDEARRQLEDARRQLRTAQSARRSLDERLKETQHELDALTLQLGNTQADAEQRAGAEGRLRARVQDLSKALDDARRQSESLAAELETAKSRDETLAAELTAASLRERAVTGELEATREALAEQQRRCDALRALADRLGTSCDALLESTFGRRAPVAWRGMAREAQRRGLGGAVDDTALLDGGAGSPGWVARWSGAGEG